jgi:hypothetical protein
MKTKLLVAALFVLVASTAKPSKADDRYAGPGNPWYEGNPRSGHKVCLYLFWHGECEGCDSAKRFALDLSKRLPWTKVVTFDLNKANNDGLYRSMAREFGQDGTHCPAMFFCGQLKVGYVSYEETGKEIEKEMTRWNELLSKRR